MNKLIFATNNEDKLFEVKDLLNNNFEILSLKDIHCNENIAETSKTLEGNASLKSSYIYKKYNVNCFADDTSLEVETLNGEPGIYSARYAGDSHDFEANLQKVLQKLKDTKNRKARFRTVISLIIDGKEYFFEGIINGEILTTKRGTNGFGYDPIFLPDGFNQSFAEMSIEQKNKVSHRGLAVKKLLWFLNTKM
jgi:XTP/dITP diphosphohydrolase